MIFRYARDSSGEITGVERVGAWMDVIDISPELMRLADPSFLTHGDGLVTFRCVNGMATYGIIGEHAVIGYSDPIVLRARLLSVRTTEDLPA